MECGDDRVKDKRGVLREGPHFAFGAAEAAPADGTAFGKFAEVAERAERLGAVFHYTAADMAPSGIDYGIDRRGAGLSRGANGGGAA